MDSPERLGGVQIEPFLQVVRAHPGREHQPRKGCIHQGIAAISSSAGTSPQTLFMLENRAVPQRVSIPSIPACASHPAYGAARGGVMPSRGRWTSSHLRSFAVGPPSARALADPLPPVYHRTVLESSPRAFRRVQTTRRTPRETAPIRTDRGGSTVAIRSERALTSPRRGTPRQA